jgi:hypothetical protein
MCAGEQTGPGGRGNMRATMGIQRVLSIQPSVTGAFNMTHDEEQQMLNSLSAIARDINLLLTRIKELAIQQDKADQQAFRALSQIAHKR